MKVAIVGTGHAGLVSGACFPEVGHDASCRDVAAWRPRFTADIEKAVGHGTIRFMAAGTPPDEKGSAGIEYFPIGRK